MTWTRDTLKRRLEVQQFTTSYVNTIQFKIVLTGAEDAFYEDYVDSVGVLLSDLRWRIDAAADMYVEMSK